MDRTALTTDPAADGHGPDDAGPASTAAPDAGRAALLPDLRTLVGDDADELAAELPGAELPVAAPAGTAPALDLDRRTGGVCYVDRYASDLAGLAARIPYLRELGLTHLHVTAVAEPAHDGDDDDGAALLAPGLRLLPGVGSAADLAALVEDLHDAQLTFSVDLSSASTDDDAATADRIRVAAREVVALASAGADLVRLAPAAVLGDADPARASALLRVLAALGRRVSPAFGLAADADPAVSDALLDGDACLLVEDAALAPLIWDALATRSGALLSRALERRREAPAGAARITRVRDHDALRFVFDDADARAIGIDPDEHRRFLAEFHTGRFPGSHARGVDAVGGAVAGTTASLAGLEQDDPGAVERILLAHSIALSIGGLPLLVLGDEVGQLNDRNYDDVAEHADDSRWINRPLYPFERYEQRDDRSTSTGVVYAGLRRLIAVRQATPALGGTRVVGFDANDPHVLGYQRPSGDGTVLVLANLGDESATVTAETLAGFADHATDLVRDEPVRLTQGIVLSPRTFVWLQAAHDLA